MNVPTEDAPDDGECQCAACEYLRAFVKQHDDAKLFTGAASVVAFKHFNMKGRWFRIELTEADKPPEPVSG